MRLEKRTLKKVAILFGVGLFFLLIGLLSWKFFFSRYYAFHNHELAFLEGAKSYYKTYPRYLPNKGETRELFLQDLYDAGKIDALYVPGSSKLCNTDSWVRVYQNENGEYEYFVNLECNRYKSKIDREGPVIELNGDMTIIADYGVEYKDPGVKSVRDNIDGEMDVSKVAVDTSKVNTNAPGLYKVTYTAYDKLHNETKVVRKVQVVDKLYSFVRRNTDESNYYKGAEVNNFVQFSGMMWQIINVNEDNSVKLILANASSNVMFGYAEKFTDTNVYRWLNNYFYPHLEGSKKYIVENANWCSNVAVFFPEDVPSECNGESYQGPVGLLSVKDLISTSIDRRSYLKGKQYYWLIDRINTENANIIYSSDYDGFMQWNVDNFGPVRPVINLNSDVFIMSGLGTIEKPYKLNDYEYGKENEEIKDRLDGEYFSYSGYLFRKIGVDKDGNAKMIMAGNMKDPKSLEQFVVGYDSSLTTWKFNPQEKGNVGYRLNEELLLHLSDRYIVRHDFEIPEIDINSYYDKWKKTKVKTWLSFPTTYELFSNYNILADTLDYNFLMLDYNPNNEVVFVNTGNSIAFSMAQDILGENAVKVVLYLKGDRKISSGRGLIDDPYYIK
ncbi:MAG: DUF5011 domain-containing protein [Bacilli bacterium]|nr:DUF5011 domain-containing protein [Bacilli bacterium]